MMAFNLVWWNFNPFCWASCISTQIHRVLMSFPIFFCLYHARRGLVRSSSCGSLWSLFMGFTAVKNRSCSSASSPAHPDPLSRRISERTPFHPKGVSTHSSQRAHPLPATLFSVSTITDGNARIGSRSTFLPLRWPDCTLSRLRVEEHDRPVTQSIATPEPDFPDLHPRSSRSSLRPWVCHHTQEPTVSFGVSCRPFYLNVDRFHQPCPLPARTSRIGEDCRPRTTWRPHTLFGAAPDADPPPPVLDTPWGPIPWSPSVFSLLEFCPPANNPEFVMESKNWSHISMW